MFRPLPADLRRQRPRRGPRTAILAAMLWVTLGAPASAAITQSAQPLSGPGGSAYTHADMRVTAGGSAGVNGWYLFEPAAPAPANAPVTVISHGYFVGAIGWQAHEALIRHTVRKGNIVIFPRWQSSPVTPCPGPFYIEPCNVSAERGIKGALAFLAARPERVQPADDTAAYWGGSFGGIITANLMNRWETLDLPRPTSIWLDDPHSGAFTFEKEYALDDLLLGIPNETKVVCFSGREGIVGEHDAGYSCGALFPRLGHIKPEDKSMVMTFPDGYGSPAVSSKHGVCAGKGRPPYEFAVDVADWGFCWRSWDALRSCAETGTDCAYALGDTPQNRYVGTWSDGTPMIGVKVQTSGPLTRGPVPPRQSNPTPVVNPVAAG